ncbi:hypothetical protein DBY21_02785 [Candidatus Gastranaerophilales bacterium]|nr:MAG: hypothetical protein DBY21_02785 [Candidatus Gastranaerophilales bacterium]
MEYGFNIIIAEKLGVNEAIMIRNFQFWLEKNKANEKNYCDGRYWTYNSIAAFCKIFPFWSRDQIRYILKKLTDKGILISGNFNKNPYDKTLWYSLDEEKMAELLKKDAENSPNPSGEIPESSCENSSIDVGIFPHRGGEITKPIPDTNANSKPCENTHTHECACENFSNSLEVDEFCKDYKALKNSEFEPSEDDRIEIAKILNKNGGYGAEKREYWCDVFKKASRGWRIIEHDITRIVPCSLDRVLNEHSRIKANELGLLPPKKDAPKAEMPSESEIVEDEALTEAAVQKARAMVNNLRYLNIPIG